MLPVAFSVAFKNNRCVYDNFGTVAFIEWFAFLNERGGAMFLKVEKHDLLITVLPFERIVFCIPFTCTELCTVRTNTFECERDFFVKADQIYMDLFFAICLITTIGKNN